MIDKLQHFAGTYGHFPEIFYDPYILMSILTPLINFKSLQ
jgi:hypothetical protein